MKKNNNYTFEITEESLLKLNEISENMEGSTFHKHTHILFDIRTEFGDKPITYLEIGSYAGASISLISSHKYPTNCFTLDLGEPINPEVVQRNIDKFKNELSTFKYFQGNSQDINIINHVNSEIKEIDFLFIDGDHTTNGVIKDFNNFSKLVKSGGYIAFDDYLDYQYSPEVKGAVDTIVSSLSVEEYDVIGSLSYDLLKEFTELDRNNIFILRKK
jgi:predicted O-methyltransferase YrrM